jgi:hypothetical protein
MRVPSIHYQVVGQDDYMLIIHVEPDGQFVVDSGDYTSHKPRRGCLDARARTAIGRLVDQLGPVTDQNAPDGARGFVAELTIDNGTSERRYRFWEGALGARPDIEALVRALELID